MRTAFKLSMPHRGSWNNKWSGDSEIFIKVRDVPMKTRKSLIEGSPHFYSWDDGWTAQVDVMPVGEVSKLVSKSRGFAGYDWMIDSLILYGEILTSKEIRERSVK